MRTDAQRSTERLADSQLAPMIGQVGMTFRPTDLTVTRHSALLPRWGVMRTEYGTRRARIQAIDVQMSARKARPRKRKLNTPLAETRRDREAESRPFVYNTRLQVNAEQSVYERDCLHMDTDRLIHIREQAEMIAEQREQTERLQERQARSLARGLQAQQEMSDIESAMGDVLADVDSMIADVQASELDQFFVLESQGDMGEWEVVASAGTRKSGEFKAKQRSRSTPNIHTHIATRADLHDVASIRPYEMTPDEQDRLSLIRQLAGARRYGQVVVTSSGKARSGLRPHV